MIIKKSNHFIDRYFERVLDKPRPTDLSFPELESIVDSDMDDRMTSREKSNMMFISGSGGNSKIPMGNNHYVISKNKTAITILYG